MSVSITISQANFSRLQLLAEPLVDTIDDVLSRLISQSQKSTARQLAEPVKYPADDSIGGIVTSSPLNSNFPNLLDSPKYQTAIEFFDPNAPPDLTHTKLLSAAYGGVKMGGRKWSKLLVAAVGHAINTLGSLESVKRLTSVQIVTGERKGSGFTYYSEIDLSIQGQDTNTLWRAVKSFAKKTSSTVEVEFEWQDKLGSAYPGKVGTMKFEPNES